MAIIKNGRINIWNAVKKQFEVVHPETETARITDFADGIVQKLALTSAMTAVTALQTDSWFGKLLKMALTASGVRYNIADNGYICFGSFFCGLIIQWGLKPNINDGMVFVSLPLSYETSYLPFTTDWTANTVAPYSIVNSVDYSSLALSGFTVTCENKVPRGFAWFAIGR